MAAAPPEPPDLGGRRARSRCGCIRWRATRSERVMGTRLRKGGNSMRLIRARVALAGGLLAVAGTIAGVVLAAGPAPPASRQVVLVNCSGHGRVRLSGYARGCIPSNELVPGLK